MLAVQVLITVAILVGIAFGVTYLLDKSDASGGNEK